MASLTLGYTGGTYLTCSYCCIIDGISHKQIIDKSVSIRQLNVVEAHGILLFRADKGTGYPIGYEQPSILPVMGLYAVLTGRDSKIHVFRLSDFESDVVSSNDFILKGRLDFKEHKIERTRGCIMYATSKPGGSHLRMVGFSCDIPTS